MAQDKRRSLHVGRRAVLKLMADFADYNPYIQEAVEGWEFDLTVAGKTIQVKKLVLHNGQHYQAKCCDSRGNPMTEELASKVDYVAFVLYEKDLSIRYIVPSTELIGRRCVTFFPHRPRQYHNRKKNFDHYRDNFGPFQA